MSQVAIKNGPSKFDMMQALFVRKPATPSVVFHLTDNVSVTAFINSVEAEDGSGESWNITGYVGNNKKFSSYYRTDKRVGHYTVFD